MASRLEREAASPEGAATDGRHTKRRRPSPTEHARRVAWGRKYGQAVAALTAEWRRLER